MAGRSGLEIGFGLKIAGSSRWVNFARMGDRGSAQAQEYSEGSPIFAFIASFEAMLPEQAAWVVRKIAES